ncbi:hypothetical protein CCR94_16520 [Rhodoblastus sphagnicola]|uniref:Peptidase S24/S26A/S26B/S26C domain-containing protein n=1 Tax=Rhodoblastus sphagnicola TaxID=333368 RepID=A0A2S6N2Z0_9HYPH|nr:LexA family transcriptional regulator [Rhodoblastus sphagnicola]MBB4199103.1 phage repressor protein C with HTH and peptisase S24 domain/transcriptional regulator with XRE-family HTH domain [Rhodoblastus sphagnicola]PPQ28994.1 hypothetical protein CCR94_16520 [Rhodoblastus sphagnicola]
MGDLLKNEHDDNVARFGARALDLLRGALQGTAQRKGIAQKTGISENTLKDYFTGRTTPPIDRFFAILLAAGLSPADAMRFEGGAPDESSDILSLSAKQVDYTACQLSALFLEKLQGYLYIPTKRRIISTLTKIPEKTLVDYQTGRTSPTVDRFLLIAAACDTVPSVFFGDAEIVAQPPGISSNFAAPTSALPAPPIEIVHIPHLDVSAAAGEGKFVDVVQVESVIPFPYVFLEKLLGDDAARARLETLRARGSSMKPTIDDGALLMIDRAQSILPSAHSKRSKSPLDVYVFLQKGDVRLKRLQRIDNDWISIHSDNAVEYQPEVFNLKRDGSFKIIGKVVWWDNRL